MIQQWESLDYCLAKEVIRQGREDGGKWPRLGAKIKVSISDIETHGNITHRSKYLGGPQENAVFRVGFADCQVDRSLEKVLLTMQDQEEARIKIRVQEPDDYLLLEFNLTVEDVEDVEPVYKWPPETKYEVATQMYEAGVELFKCDRLADAFEMFRQALNLVYFVVEGENFDRLGQSLMDGQHPRTEPTCGLLKDKSMLSDVRALLTKCQKNLSAAHFKQNNYKHVIRILEPFQDVKSLYRRGVSKLQVGDYDGAIKDLNQAQVEEPSNKAVAVKLKETKALKSKYELQLSKGMMKMFK